MENVINTNIKTDHDLRKIILNPWSVFNHLIAPALKDNSIPKNVRSREENNI